MCKCIQVWEVSGFPNYSSVESKPLTSGSGFRGGERLYPVHPSQTTSVVLLMLLENGESISVDLVLSPTYTGEVEL